MAYLYALALGWSSHFRTQFRRVIQSQIRIGIRPSMVSDILQLFFKLISDQMIPGSQGGFVLRMTSSNYRGAQASQLHDIHANDTIDRSFHFSPPRLHVSP